MFDPLWETYHDSGLSLSAQGLLSLLVYKQRDGKIEGVSTRSLAYEVNASFQDIQALLRELQRKKAISFSPRRGKKEYCVFLHVDGLASKEQKLQPVQDSVPAAKQEPKDPDRYALSRYTMTLEELEQKEAQYTIEPLSEEDPWVQAPKKPIEKQPAPVKKQPTEPQDQPKEGRRRVDMSRYHKMTWVEFWRALREDPRRQGTEKLNKILAFQEKYQPRHLLPEMVEDYASRRLMAPVSHMCKQFEVLEDGEIKVTGRILASQQYDKKTFKKKDSAGRSDRIDEDDYVWTPPRIPTVKEMEAREPEPVHIALRLSDEEREAFFNGIWESLGGKPEPKPQDKGTTIYGTTSRPQGQSGSSQAVSRASAGEQRGGDGSPGIDPTAKRPARRGFDSPSSIGSILSKELRNIPGLEEFGRKLGADGPDHGM